MSNEKIVGISSRVCVCVGGGGAAEANLEWKSDGGGVSSGLQGKYSRNLLTAVLR